MDEILNIFATPVKYLLAGNIIQLDVSNSTIFIIGDFNITNEVRNQGFHQIKWDASDLSSGLYFYKLKTENFTLTKKCLLLK